MQTIKTVLHSYYFDTRNPDEKEAYKALKAKLKAQGLTRFESWGGKGSHYMPELDNLTIDLETKFLFSNQWNTGPILPTDKTGRRVFDWAQDYKPYCKNLKQGHYLEQTEEMRTIRANRYACGYCGNQEDKTIALQLVFCPHCLDSEYLKESDLHLTKYKSILDKNERKKLSPEEFADRLPLYKEAQLHGTTERGKRRLKEQREEIQNKFKRAIRTAHAERDGLIWLLDRGFKIDNVIYYNHREIFCFGWRSPIEKSIKSALLDVLSEFPFEYEFKEK